MSLPIFDQSLGYCGDCELEPACSRGRVVPGRAASKEPCGLMIIGEGPGTTEVSRGEPFVGAAGHELNQLLSFAGIEREACHVTNATLCLPPPAGRGNAKTFVSRFPKAVPSCLERLEAEIAARRPRVIVTLGRAPLVAATGEWGTYNRQVKVTCSVCARHDRKVGPAIACASRREDGAKCTWLALCPDDMPLETWHAQLLETHEKRCPECGAVIHRLKPRRVRCPSCGGRKVRVEVEPIYKEPGYKLLGKDGIAGALFLAEELPHRWDRFGVKYIIATLHPAYLLHSDSGEDRKGLTGQFAARVVVDHLKKASRLLTRDHVFDVEPILVDQVADLVAFTEAPGVYTLDIETNAKSPWDVSELRCIGIGRDDSDEVLVVDTRRLFGVHASEQAGQPTEFVIRILDRALFDALAAFLTHPDKGKEALNGAYDYLVLRRFFGLETSPVAGDALLAHRALWPDEPHNLKHVASELTDAPHWKPPKQKGGVESFETFTDLAVYNAKDVRSTALSMRELAGPALERPEPLELPLGVRVPRWRRGGLLERVSETFSAFALDAAMYPMAVRMEHDGIPVSLLALRRVAEEKQPEADALHQQLVDYVGPLPVRMHHDGELTRYGRKVSIPKDQIKLSSPPQLAWALYDPNGPCRLVCPARTPTGAPSTEKDVLAKLADNEFVQLLLRWRALDKTLSTYVYGDGLITRADGRIHPSWNFVPVTGRWSSSPNFQNWPAWLRAAVEAPPGWVIVGADEAQLELRIMAALSGDDELIRRCRSADESRKLEAEWDPHSFVASQFFGAAFLELDLGEPDHVKRRKALREIIKSCIYGMNYGAGAQKVLETIYKKGYQGVPITLQIVRQVIDTIFALFPGVLAWREETLAQAQALGEVRSALLRRWRYFPKEVPAPVAWNYPIQTTAADLVNLLVYAYALRLPQVSPRAWIMAQVHDALYTICPEEDAQAVAALKTEVLSVPDLVLVPGAAAMPFVATAKVGKTWDKVS